VVAGFWGGGRVGGTTAGAWEVAKTEPLEPLRECNKQAQLARTEATGARNDRNWLYFPRGREDPVQRLLPDASGCEPVITSEGRG